ncbi:type IV secretion system DNA-binding domain-containing protein [Candidatus Berkelbacteria bacterium]|nr:type IV secretion system DNA-binding domain-containing protein [Candidatus Berkelbacteria bacterium]
MSTHEDARVVILGRTNFRNSHRLVGIAQPDRRHHTYVIGKTGTGKSTLLETMIRQDIVAGQGLVLFDPHGDLVERVLASVPEARKPDLIYFNVPDTARPLGFNPLERVAPTKRAIAAAGMLEVFKKIWSESWGPRLEHILRNGLLALMDQPEATLADLLRLLDDADFRKRAAERVANAQVRRFWLHEFEGYPSRFRAEAIAPVQNKVGAFLANPILHAILTQPRSSFDPRRLMDSGRILLVNLAKGKIGEDAAALMGALLVSGIGLAALSRSDVPEVERRDFFVYLDEFQSFTTLSLATMLSELRKYRVSLVLAHQYLSQLDEPIRDAVLGNVGTMVCFRVGAEDAEFLEREFSPEFSARDLVDLPNYNIYLRLMVAGVVSRPFSGETIRRAHLGGMR